MSLLQINQYSKMYQLECKITEDQRSLLADALYYYSEMLNTDPEGSAKLNALEELEEHLDAHFKQEKTVWISMTFRWKN